MSGQPPPYSQATGPNYNTNYGPGVGYQNSGYAAPPQGSGAPYPPTVAMPLPPPRAMPIGQPGKDSDVESNPDFAGEGFSDKKLRRNFIKKVYMILSAQLLVTMAVVALFLFVKPIKDFIRGDGFWLYYVSYAIFLVTYIALVCCPSVRRKWPGNFICLAVFTLAFAYMLATISSFYDFESILIAAAITTVVCVGVSIFAIQTKIDFTMCSSLLFGLLLVLILFGFGCMITFLVAPVDSRTYYILRCVYGGLGALVFTLFLIFDTQMVVGGKNRKFQLSPEDYISGALQLYLDIVYIFLMILSLFGGGSNN